MGTTPATDVAPSPRWIVSALASAALALHMVRFAKARRDAEAAGADRR